MIRSGCRDEVSMAPPCEARDVVLGSSRETCRDIADAGVAAAIWQRPLPEGLMEWLDTLAPGELPTRRRVLPLHLVEAAVIETCEEAELAPTAGRDLFARDVASLALEFGTFMRAETLSVRLDVARDAMCPKFHLDQVRARLLCTYRGEGTEYVTDTMVDAPRRHRRLKRGAVGVFRGADWSDSEPCRLLHRSPELAPGDPVRLLLVIDPA